MKKIVLTFLSLLFALAPALVKGQTFTMQYPTDTVYVTYTGVPIHDDINPTGGPIWIKWHVLGTNFPADWLADTTFGICDASLCRSNLSGQLWPTANSYKAQYPDPLTSAKTFDLNVSYNFVSSGTHYITVKLEDTVAAYSKNITFFVTKGTTGVSTVVNNENEVVLYPNPAHDEVNVVYDANADIKNIAVYNIIGKLMSVYKVNGPSANLNLENIPSGIYFVQLVNSRGNVVVTKKFTKQ